MSPATPVAPNIVLIASKPPPEEASLATTPTKSSLSTLPDFL